MAAIVLIRGLNTYGDDHLHIGPLNFVPMYQPLEEELTRRQHKVLAIRGLDFGPISDQSLKAGNLIKAWCQDQGINQFHILAHSMGGLTSRQLLHDPNLSAQCLSLLTLATPHRGSVLSHWVNETFFKKPFYKKALKLFQYDLDPRMAVINSLTPEALSEFNRLYPDVVGPQYASLVFSTRLREMAWPLRATSIALRKHGAKFNDGMVPKDSQPWGKVLSENALDHFAQLGFFLHIRKQKRERQKQLWLKLLDQMEEFWSAFE